MKRYMSDVLSKMKEIIKHVRQYTVFDIETTGLSPNKGDMITEIGAVKMINGKVVSRYDQLINPGKRIPSNITEITHITNDMVRNKPSIQEALPDFLKFIGGDVLVAHNGYKFDKPFVSYFVRRFYGHELENELVDTVLFSRDIFPEIKHNLDVLAEKFDISLENHHRADQDAEATAAIFLKLCDIYMDMDKEISEENMKTAIVQAPVSETIKSIQSWRLKNMNRLYVNLDTGTVFYDFMQKAWRNKNYIIPPDYHNIETRILKHFNKESIDELALADIKMIV